MTENAKAAAKALGIEFEVEKITSINEIMDLGVMITPALAVDGEVKFTGKVASVDEIKGIIQ